MCSFEPVYFGVHFLRRCAVGSIGTACQRFPVRCAWRLAFARSSGLCKGWFSLSKRRRKYVLPHSCSQSGDDNRCALCALSGGIVWPAPFWLGLAWTELARMLFSEVVWDSPKVPESRFDICPD